MDEDISTVTTIFLQTPSQTVKVTKEWKVAMEGEIAEIIHNLKNCS